MVKPSPDRKAGSFCGGLRHWPVISKKKRMKFQLSVCFYDIDRLEIGRFQLSFFWPNKTGFWDLPRLPFWDLNIGESRVWRLNPGFGGWIQGLAANPKLPCFCYPRPWNSPGCCLGEGRGWKISYPVCAWSQVIFDVCAWSQLLFPATWT